jgi:hypothetical protein
LERNEIGRLLTDMKESQGKQVEVIKHILVEGLKTRYLVQVLLGQSSLPKEQIEKVVRDAADYAAKTTQGSR